MGSHMSQISLAEQLQHVTCLVKTDGGSGTGFIYNISAHGNSTMPMLVTNRHVIDGSTKTNFRMTTCNADNTPNFGKYVDFEIPTAKWKNHPTDGIDLAMTPIAGLLNQAVASGHKPFYRLLSADLIADDSYLMNMDAIESITMIGYPTGIFDEANNLPVIRRGITASRIGLRYNGRPEFLIDCACFPGSSGSPVFHYDTGPELTRDGSMSMSGVRFKFLGILWGGPMHNVAGEIVAKPIETAVKPVSVTQVMMNLGFCIRASELAGFESVFQSEIGALTNESAAP
jgi:hypothetical protein